jgi:hypothetical protein
MMQRERRQTTRLIMRVPMWVGRVARQQQIEEDGVESLNISIRGSYFATRLKFQEGEKISVRIWMPEQIAPGQRTEWCFTARIAHVEPLGTAGGLGVGVHFLYYTAGKKLPVEFMSAPRSASLARGIANLPHIP